MKKIFLVGLLVAVTVCVIFAQGESGTIRELSGEVELKHAGSNAFVAARAGDRVAQNTIVSTGFKGTAIIAVGSSVITVRPLTRLSLAEIQSSRESETLNVNLQAGRVRVDVNPPAGTKANTVVQSPSATARGTSFEFDTINLSVNEGTVAFSGNLGPAEIVKAGGESFIKVDGDPADPIGTKADSLLPPAPVGTVPDEAHTTLPSSTGDININY